MRLSPPHPGEPMDRTCAEIRVRWEPDAPTDPSRHAGLLYATRMTAVGRKRQFNEIA